MCALGLSFPFRGVSPASARPFCISALSGRCPAVGALRGLLRCGRLGGFLFPRGFRVGLHARREASGIGIEDKSGQFLDVFQQRAFVFRAECDRRAVVPGASRASDAVYIGFGHFRQVVIDDQRQFADVDPPRGDVGGDQYAAAARPEIVHGPFAGPLRLVAVDGAPLDARFGEDAGDAVRAVLGARENQHRAFGAFAQQADEQVFFLGLFGEHDALADRLDDRRRRRDGDVHRVVEHRIGQRDDVRGHRRRKEERLPLFGQQRKYPFDVVDETHVEHPVGFVEHEEADVGERDVSLSDQVEQAARRGDQQVDAALQGVHLRTLVDAAEDHAVAQVGVAGVVAAALVDLDRQFARGREHQRLDGAASFGAGPGREQLQDRQREGRRLARSCLGAAHQVASFECGRNGLLLNGRGGDVALLGYGVHDGFYEVQFLECHCISVLFRFWEPDNSYCRIIYGREKRVASDRRVLLLSPQRYD